MTRRLLLPLTLILFALPLFAARQIIPVAGHLPGAGGTSWSTDVTLTNLGAAQQVQLVFHPAGGAAVTRTVDLAAGQTLFLPDAVNPSNFSGAASAPWLGLLEINSPGEVRASSRTFSGSDTTGGTYGSSYEAVDPAVLTNHGVVTGIVSSGAFRTNVAFTNPTDTAQTFHFDVRGSEGELRGGDAIRVGAMSTLQIPLGAYVQTTTDDALSLNWTADNRGFAVASVVDNRSGDPTGISSVAVGSNRLFFPIVGSTPGRESTFWTTSVAVTSQSDSDGVITLRFNGNDGQVKLATFPLKPHGTFRTGDLFSLLGLGSGAGFLTVDSTVPAVGSARVFNTTEDRGTFGSAIASQEELARGSHLRIRGVRRDADFRLNVGIANDDATATSSGTIRLFDDRGGLVESQPFTLAPSTSAQFAMTHTPNEVHGGEVEIEVEHGAPVTAIASNVDNRSGDTSVGEVEQENERQREAEISFSPKTATAGTPVTLNASLPGISDATFTWDFGDGTTATGPSVTHTFVNAGEYAVTVTATLAGGATVRETEDITVLGPNDPLAGSFDFSWTPAAPAAGRTVTFTATGGSGTTHWHFPGGVRLTGNPVTFTFDANGSYEVEAELEREGSPTLRVEHVVVVGGSGQQPPPGGPATTMTITADPSSPAAGQNVTFRATFDTTPSSGAVVKWRFPDGSRPTGNPVTYKFNAPGSYEVEAELEQQGKATIERQIIVTVH